MPQTFVTTVVHYGQPYQIETDCDNIAQAVGRAADETAHHVAAGRTVVVAPVPIVKAVPRGH